MSVTMLTQLFSPGDLITVAALLLVLAIGALFPRAVVTVAFALAAYAILTRGPLKMILEPWAV